MTKQVEVGFNLNISSGNAAFQEDATGEVSRILCEIAGQIDNGRDHGSCQDINGNSVGKWWLEVQVEDDSESDSESDSEAEDA